MRQAVQVPDEPPVCVYQARAGPVEHLVPVHDRDAVVPRGGQRAEPLLVCDGVGFSEDSLGRGYGIANVKRRIGELGGVVQYETDRDQGAMVRITVPLPASSPTKPLA